MALSAENSARESRELLWCFAGQALRGITTAVALLLH